jgi:hypothetical protein
MYGQSRVNFGINDVNLPLEKVDSRLSDSKPSHIYINLPYSKGVGSVITSERIEIQGYVRYRNIHK